jgi:hypothetical protein
MGEMEQWRMFSFRVQCPGNFIRLKFISIMIKYIFVKLKIMNAIKI